MTEETREFHLHLVSDATGETLGTVARACLAQFPDVTAREHVWSLVRTRGQVERVVAAINAAPGVVLFSLINPELQKRLIDGCRGMQLPCIDVLQPTLAAFAHHLGLERQGQPGGQHKLDAGYFDRIAAMDFAMSHDDGQGLETIDQADVILVGVSRTSKTPTCVYLAHRGLRAANFPLVPGHAVPDEILRIKNRLVVGLTVDPNRLVEVRRNRLRNVSQVDEFDYVDPDQVNDEIREARRMFTRLGWPVIDVTRRSIEETAASIIQLYHKKLEKLTEEARGA